MSMYTENTLSQLIEDVTKCSINVSSSYLFKCDKFICLFIAYEPFGGSIVTFCIEYDFVFHDTANKHTNKYTN